MHITFATKGCSCTAQLPPHLLLHMPNDAMGAWDAEGKRSAEQRETNSGITRDAKREHAERMARPTKMAGKTLQAGDRPGRQLDGYLSRAPEGGFRGGREAEGMVALQKAQGRHRDGGGTPS